MGGSRRDGVLTGLGVVLGVIVVAASLVTDKPTVGYDLLAVVLVIGSYGVLFAHRRAPLLPVLVTMALGIVWFQRGYVGALTAPALLLAVYLLARTGHTRRTVAVLAAVITPTVVTTAFADDVESVSTAVGILGWYGAAALLGEAVARRAEQLDENERRLAAVAAEQALAAERRADEERLGIARDLHDLLAHSVTAMTIQAGVALDAVGRDDEAARDALRTIRRIGDSSVHDVRATARSLRSGDRCGDDRGDVIGLAGLHDLCAASDRDGVAVALTSDFEPEDVPELVDISAFRIAQEALTNVLRHSHAHRAELSVVQGADRLRVEISDPGPSRAAASEDSPGLGLTGMRERVDAVGGRLAVARPSGGGFTVVADLPLGAR